MVGVCGHSPPPFLPHGVLLSHTQQHEVFFLKGRGSIDFSSGRDTVCHGKEGLAAGTWVAGPIAAAVRSRGKHGCFWFFKF